MNAEPRPDALPKVDGPIVGFRAWVPSTPEVSGELQAQHLGSTNFSYIWSPGTNVAQHLHYVGLGNPPWLPDDHVAPMWGCQCGFYIMRDMPAVLDALQRLGLKSDLVFGAVTGWGKTIEHRLGWRCQYASILALFDERELAYYYEVDAVAEQDKLYELAEWARGRTAHPRLRDHLVWE